MYIGSPDAPGIIDSAVHDIETTRGVRVSDAARTALHDWVQQNADKVSKNAQRGWSLNGFKAAAIDVLHRAADDAIQRRGGVSTLDFSVESTISKPESAVESCWPHLHSAVRIMVTNFPSRRCNAGRPALRRTPRNSVWEPGLACAGVAHGPVSPCSNPSLLERDYKNGYS